MKVRALVNGAGKVLILGLVALLLWLALTQSPLRPDSARAADTAKSAAEIPSKKEGAKEHTSKEHGKKDHESPAERTALHHVLDSSNWEFFDALPHWHLPKIFGFQITKFMVLELIAAFLVAAVYIPLARRMQRGDIVHGPFLNFFEVLLTFVRDQIAKPSIGDHDADRYVPFLWTLFLFILFNNLLGMFPFGGSATANINVTLALAFCVFLMLHGSGIQKMGFVKYVLSLWPHIDVPFPLGLPIKVTIFIIEWVGVLVRNVVLAVRLFANMFAGHMVLATLLLFIYMARNAHPVLWGGITLSSVLGIVALSLLELFVAFLQAYIFTFLTALFMGMALHPEH